MSKIQRQRELERKDKKIEKIPKEENGVKKKKKRKRKSDRNEKC